MKNKTYDGYVTKLEPNMVFVFGSNYDSSNGNGGFHGAGSAGYASFGVAGNRWREFDYGSKPMGWKGKWNVKGVGKGYQQGTDGASYALPTVKQAGAKRSILPNELRENISEFYEFCKNNPDKIFYVAQENKMGLNGYSPNEMAKFFTFCDIPDNVRFNKEFYQLMFPNTEETNSKFFVDTSG